MKPHRAFSRICPVCKSKVNILFKKLLPHYSFNNQEKLLRCLACGFTSIFPFPDKKQIMSIYSGDNYITNYEKLDIKWAGGKRKTADYLEKKLTEIEALISNKGKLLDIGAGSGAFLAFAQTSGWQVKGVEVSPEWIKYAKKNFGIKLFQGELKQASFPSNSFDLVHLNHVFEHVYHPIELLIEIKRILKPGGYLIIEVPQEIYSLSELIQFNLSNKILLRPLTNKLLLQKRAIPQLPPSLHLFFFTVKSLKKLMENSGFQVKTLKTIRRNKQTDKTIYAWERIARLVYALEKKLHLGPNITLTALKP